MPSTSGHWEVSKNGKQYFVQLSGGYVIVGARVTSPVFEVQDNSNASVENYSKSQVRNFIKQQLGDKILEEVDAKVNLVIELKNKPTSGPGKE